MKAAIPISGRLGLGDILDRAFRLYRARFGQFLLAAAIFLVPMNVIVGLAQSGNARSAAGSNPVDALGGTLLYLIALAVSSWLLGGMAYLTLTAHAVSLLHGGAPSVRSSIGEAWSRLAAYVGYSIGKGILTAIAVAVVMVPMMCAVFAVAFGANLAGSGAAALAAVSGAAILFTVVLAIAPLVYINARWIVAVPALVIERRGPVDCLRRSWGLTRGNVWRCIGYAILIGILGYLVAFLPALLLGFLLGAALGAGAISTIAASVLGSVFGVVWQPVAAAALVLLYFDLRVRNEDYDLALRVDRMVEAVEDEMGGPLPGPEPAAYAAPRPETRFNGDNTGTNGNGDEPEEGSVPAPAGGEVNDLLQ